MTASESDTKAIVTNLNAGWYNAVTQAMGISDPNFQLAQGTLGLQTSDSSGLFLMADAVPPSAAVGYFDPSGLSKRSSAYGLLLSALLPETGTDLQNVLKDQYAGWIAYRNAWFTTNPTSTLTQMQLFQQWANQRLDPRLAAQAINTFQQAANTPLNQALDTLHSAGAQQQFVDSSSNTYSLYKYSGTITNATQGVQTGGGPATINFDSNTMNTSLSHTTVQGSASGFYDIFSAGASGSFEQLDEKAASQRITITGTINKYATLVTTPVTWFASSEYSRAYNAKGDNRVWDPLSNAGDWDSFFAQPNGSLARRTGQLFLVSGYDITVTSYASYSQSDLQTIQTQASFGIWPFFSASASATHTTQSTLNSDSNLVVTHHLNPGLIQIWGVITQNAPS